MMKHNPDFLKLVRLAKKRIQEYNVSKVKKKINRGDSFFFIDVREVHEFEKGHAKGAIHLGKGMIERDFETLIPDQKAEIVLYYGGGYRSAFAAEQLWNMGYRRAISMPGGFRAWVNKKYPVAAGSRGKRQGEGKRSAHDSERLPRK